VKRYIISKKVVLEAQSLYLLRMLLSQS